MVNVDIEHLAEAINRELTIYSAEVTDTIKRGTKEHMDDLVKKTKATAPVGRRKKHYRNNITSKMTEESINGVTYTWYVKGPDYRLSHLLENGHATKKGGRVEGTHFIAQASEEVISSYTQWIEEVLRNG